MQVDQPRDVRAEPGSFRDRDGQVFYEHGHVYRGLSASALEDWKALEQSALVPGMFDRGHLIPTRLIDPVDHWPADLTARWSGFLLHDRVPVVSYPYEWSFGMLKDAALLTLDILQRALDAGLTLKDATAYNVQWRGASPVFVDIPSLQRQRPGEPWAGYRQFCEMFLAPLILQSYKDVAFHSWLRGSLDGIPIDDLARLMSSRDLFRSGVLKHVYLQSRLQSGYADSNRDVKSELKESGFNTELIKANVRGLAKLVEGLEWKQARSEWSDYAEGHSYNASDYARKQEFVRAAVRDRHRDVVWDVGCNTGDFSRVAAVHADQVLAMDADHLAIERLYQELKAGGPGNILPLVNNLANPSPAIGWDLRERTPLIERGKPDLILNLALIHHIVIGANVPVSAFLSWLTGTGADVVVEFVTREDEMVQKLLRNKLDNYDDYNLESFEQQFEKLYEVVSREELKSGKRVIFFGRLRQA